MRFLVRTVVLTLSLFVAISVGAMPLNYEATITAPISFPGDTIGGTSEPITFAFTVDSDAPNTFGTDINGGYAGTASQLSIGSAQYTLGAPGIYIGVNASGAVFNVSSQAAVPGQQIQGHELLSVFFGIFDFDAPLMLSNVALPSTSAFPDNTSRGFLQITLSATPEDRAIGYDYRYYTSFLSRSEFTLALVPIPGIVSLMGLGLIGLMISRRRGLNSCSEPGSRSESSK